MDRRTLAPTKDGGVQICIYTGPGIGRGFILPEIFFQTEIILGTNVLLASSS